MGNTSDTARGTIEMVVAMTIAGTIGIFVVESGLPPLVVVFYRCLFGAAALGLYCLFQGSFKIRGTRPRTVALVALGGVFLVSNWVLLFEAFRLTSISIATIVYHVNPFIILFLGMLAFGESVQRRKMMWTVAAFAGLVMVIGLPVGYAGDYPLGIALALLATALYSCTIVFAKWLPGLAPELIAFLQVALGAVLLLPIARPWEVPASGGHWPYLVTLGIVHTGLMYALLYAAFQRLSMPLIAILSFVFPVVAVILDGVVYDHRLGFLQWVGVAIIAVATIAVRLDWKLLPRRGRALS
ncbi:MAG: DMT family transporter [Alphaproteobacteria bacterium]|nr:DMT family transporter [Alphaproteobacteria bacterium]